MRSRFLVDFVFPNVFYAIDKVTFVYHLTRSVFRDFSKLTFFLKNTLEVKPSLGGVVVSNSNLLSFFLASSPNRSISSFGRGSLLFLTFPISRFSSFLDSFFRLHPALTFLALISARDLYFSHVFSWLRGFSFIFSFFFFFFFFGTSLFPIVSLCGGSFNQRAAQ